MCFALTTLLHYYVEDKYAETIFALSERSDTNLYYVHMAVAWLIAEAFVKIYDKAKSFLLENTRLLPLQLLLYAFQDF